MNRRQPRGFPADVGEESFDRAATILIEDIAWLPQTFDAQSLGLDPLDLRDQVAAGNTSDAMPAEDDENSLLDRELTGDYAQDTVE